MPLTLRDYAPFVTPRDQAGQGARGLHTLAEGLRELTGLADRRNAVAAQIAQAQAEERGRGQRAAAELSAQGKIAAAKASADRKNAALKQFTDFSQGLLKPGGASRAGTQLPALQAAGVRFTQTPEGGYHFGYEGDGRSEDWGALDLTGLSEQDKQATIAMLQAAQGASTARAPAEVATHGAEAVQADPSLAGEDALKAYGEATNPQLNRIAAERRANIGAAAAATRQQTTMDPQQADKAFKNSLAIARNVQNNARVRQIAEQATLSEQAASQMASGNPIEQNQAFLGQLKAAFGSRSSDKELSHMLSQGGLAQRLQNAFTRMASGEFSEDFRADFIAAAKIIAKVQKRRLRQIARQTGDAVRKNAVIAQQAGDPNTLESLAQGVEQQIISGALDETAPELGATPSHDDEADDLMDGLP